ncbi:MAG: NEW3 domain-containing protein [Methanoregulaceae archaeon]|nr:NEW3 domain-containing protein [Methanoregulaceae archaeon]
MRLSLKPTRFFIAVLGILLLCMTLPVVASVPSVIITDYDVTPAVLLPGEQGIISVTVRNTADRATLTQSYLSDTTETTTNIDINAPIDSVTMVGNGIQVISEGYYRVGDIGPGQSIPLSFLIKAPAESGIYFPEIWIRVSDARSLKYPIPVNVNSEVAIQKRPQISIEKQLPESVTPGDAFNATILLENNGQLSASNLRISVNSSTPSITSKTASTYNIERLGPGESQAITMEFSTDRNAPLGLRPVTLVIEYQEPDGSFRQQVETLGVNIRGKAELDISQITTDPDRIQKGDQFTLIIRIENTGTDDAKSVDATIGIPLPGTKEAFVGKIEPGNDAPAPFNLEADRSGEIPYTLTIRFEDDYGPGEQEQELHLNVYSDNNTTLILGVVILIILAGIFGYWYFVIRRKPGTGNV